MALAHGAEWQALPRSVRTNPIRPFPGLASSWPSRARSHHLQGASAIDASARAGALQGRARRPGWVRRCAADPRGPSRPPRSLPAPARTAGIHDDAHRRPRATQVGSSSARGRR